MFHRMQRFMTHSRNEGCVLDPPASTISKFPCKEVADEPLDFLGDRFARRLARFACPSGGFSAAGRRERRQAARACATRPPRTDFAGATELRRVRAACCWDELWRLLRGLRFSGGPGVG